MSVFSYILLNIFKIGVLRVIECKFNFNILEYKRIRMEGVRGDEIEIYVMFLVIVCLLWRWVGKYFFDFLICVLKLGIVN